MEEKRVCSACGEEKAIDQYGRNPTCYGGREPRCRQCKNEGRPSQTRRTRGPTNKTQRQAVASPVVPAGNDQVLRLELAQAFLVLYLFRVSFYASVGKDLVVDIWARSPQEAVVQAVQKPEFEPYRKSILPALKSISVIGRKMFDLKS